MFVTHHHAWGSGSSLICFLPWVGCVFFKLVWNRSSNSSKFSNFPSKVGLVVVRFLGSFRFCYCYCWSCRSCWYYPTAEGPTEFGLLQLLQECSRCGIVADLWASLLWFAWRIPRAAIRNHFLKSCHHVRAIANVFFNSSHHVRGLLPDWVSWSAGWTNRELHFGIGIIQGTIPTGFPVFWVAATGCSRSGSGASPYLWVQKKLVEFW